MACWHCGKRLAEGVRICAYCGADQRTPGQKPRAAKSLAQQEKARPATKRRVSMGIRAGARWPWLVGVALVGAAVAAILLLRPVRPPLAELEASAPDAPRPCQAESRCLVVYLAPWAPSTERTLGTVKRLAENQDPDLGLVVVIGADEPEAMEALARSLPVPALLDPDDRLVTALAIETTPTWLLLDGTGAVEERVEGVFFPYDYHLEKLGIR